MGTYCYPVFHEEFSHTCQPLLRTYQYFLTNLSGVIKKLILVLSSAFLQDHSIVRFAKKHIKVFLQQTKHKPNG